MNPPPACFNQTIFREVLTACTSTDDWSRWFKDLRVSLTPSEILVKAPSRFVANQVATRFLPEVENAVRTAGKGTSSLEVRVTVNQARPTSPSRSSNGLPAPAPPLPAEKAPRPRDARHPSNRHRLDNFVVGPSNYFAHAVASAVAEEPGGHYNPLFIYASSGLGKSHLLHAIANHARKRHPNLVVRYCTSENFVQQFIQCVSRGQMDKFRRRFRQVDMLLLDDFQFLEGKEQTLEEFFWTFNSLYQRGRQIILSCDRRPRDLTAVEDRIRSRVSGGLLADIMPPTFETRLAILRSMEEKDPQPQPLSEELLSMVAARVTDNVRDLESALRRLSAYSGLTNSPLTSESAARLLAPISDLAASAPTPEKIIAVCAEAFGISSGEILDRSRRPIPSAARRMAMYLTRELTELSFPKIGKAFDRDHSTVISAYRGTLSQISRDRRFANRVTAIHNSIHSP